MQMYIPYSVQASSLDKMEINFAKKKRIYMLYKIGLETSFLQWLIDSMSINAQLRNGFLYATTLAKIVEIFRRNQQGGVPAVLARNHK